MNPKKLKKLKALLRLCIILIVAILILVYYRSESAVNNSSIKSQDSHEIQTDITINVAELDSGRFIRDYTNPTAEEVILAYDKYGFGNCYFNEKGLVVKADEYGLTEDRLITNVWTDTTYTNKVIKPEIGQLNLIEVGETYLKIYLDEVTENDVKQYIKLIEDEYSEKIKYKNDAVIYYARSESGAYVKIRYTETKSTSMILYEF